MTVPVSVLVSAPASVPALVSAPAPASVSMLPSLSARGYTWPGSSWRPSACGADVIATRPQVLEVSASAEQLLCQSHSVFAWWWEGLGSTAGALASRWTAGKRGGAFGGGRHFGRGQLGPRSTQPWALGTGSWYVGGGGGGGGHRGKGGKAASRSRVAGRLPAHAPCGDKHAMP